jgi:hypothetical protein
MFDHIAIPLEQNMQTPIAEAAAILGDMHWRRRASSTRVFGTSLSCGNSRLLYSYMLRSAGRARHFAARGRLRKQMFSRQVGYLTSVPSLSVWFRF